MKLHERLRELRSERGLRLKDVAETAEHQCALFV